MENNDMNTTETNRREFEEWKHKQGGHYMSRNNTLGSDLSGYQDPFTEGQWKAWQAARERQTRPMQDACELIADIMRDEVNIVDECEKFLRAYAPQLLFPPNPPTSEKTYSPFDEPMEYHQSISS